MTSEHTAKQLRELLDDVYRAESRRILATLIRLLGDFDRAEEALHDACGLTTEEIARAFLTAPPTLAQRIVRAKAKIRDAHIPYQVPSRAELSGSLDVVLHVLYLVFNEGYSASFGDNVVRHDLSAESIRLGRLLVELLPEPEAIGLLALMLLHDARRASRTSADGEVVLLDDQDRMLWNRAQID